MFNRFTLLLQIIAFTMICISEKGFREKINGWGLVLRRPDNRNEKIDAFLEITKSGEKISTMFSASLHLPIVLQ